MDTKIRDAESRVGRLLADFYQKLEQLDVAHPPEQEPKQSAKILMASIRQVQLKATVERQLTREVNMAYKTDVKAFCRWLVSLLNNFMLFESQLFASDRQRMYGEKQRRQQAAQKSEPGAQPRPSARPATGAPHTKGCLRCGSEDHKVLKCPKCPLGEAQRLLHQLFKKPQVAAVAAPDRRDEVKPKVVGAAVDMGETTAVPVLRTLECAINGLKVTTLLDSGADQSVLSPTFLSRLKVTGNFPSAVRLLDTAIELDGFLEGMKLQVDHDVKLCLTFETAEGTMVLANLNCSVAATPLQEGLGDLIVSVYDLDRLGDKETPQMAGMKVVETKEKPTLSIMTESGHVSLKLVLIGRRILTKKSCMRS
ncbi:hypothetical protein B5M09_011143 [Aphanomyces astaci]|uniref:Peptidase A2 domain-containing protein n=1 Tax=Aphanomyces astaci TaxID=112090 RepID=A0A425DGX3_APHAT|nr:hypothetical protein B5M09_011143 [Aphanomyces astaci]